MIRTVQERPAFPAVTVDDFHERVTAHPGTILLFWAVWDPGSVALGQLLASSLTPDLTFYAVDVDRPEVTAVCVRYAILTTPTLVFLLHGNEGGRLVRPRNTVEVGNTLRAWQQTVLVSENRQ